LPSTHAGTCSPSLQARARVRADDSAALKGFVTPDHPDARPAFTADMGRWIREGHIEWRETVVAGLERAPKAFLGLFRGDSLGKMLVDLR
jgi:NADPH-dependent curcumin reductase CurA